MSIRHVLRSVLVVLAAGLAVAMLAPVGPALAEPGDPLDPGPSALRAANRVSLEIATLTPRVVTSDTRSITIRGKLRNIGDRPITNVELRMQLGERLDSQEAIQTALVHPPDAAVALSDFTPVTRRLAPRADADFAMRVDIGTAPGQLPLTERGIFPLLLNANGTPEYGGQARVGSLDMLLPVRSVPGGSPAPRRRGSPPQLTMLWPLVDDRPRRVGTQGDKQVLSDDELATSLAPGGRLYDLVDTANSAIRQDSDMASSLCFAIDPDLVQTARRMVGGYRVRSGDGEGRTKPGKGASAATEWLNRLSDLVSGHCVLALPYADADLVALARQGITDLERLAVNSSSVLTHDLGAGRPVQNVVWPAGGSLDRRSLADLAGDGTRTVVMDPGVLGRSSAAGPLPLESSGEGAAPRALRLDRLVSSALGGSSVERGRQSGAPMASQTPADTPSVAVQDGLAAVLYRTVFEDPEESSNPSMLIAPPRRWQAPASELRTLLQFTQAVFHDGLATPVSLRELSNAAPALSSVSVDYPPAAAAGEVPRSVTDQVADDNAKQRDLLGAMKRDGSTGREPGTVVLPVRQALLRATSSAWRGIGRDGAVEAARNASNQLQGLTSLVSVSRPGLPVSMASDNSRLPLTIRNGLPVAIRVQVKINNAAGLDSDSNIERLLPAGLVRTTEVRARVLRSGRFTVDVALSTPGGTQLGQPVRIELSSSAYGGVTLAVAGTAFGALLLLSGRRIYRRVRTGRDTAVATPAPPAAAIGVSKRRRTSKR